jgi:hypothetical protein
MAVSVSTCRQFSSVTKHIEFTPVHPTALRSGMQSRGIGVNFDASNHILPRRTSGRPLARWQLHAVCRADRWQLNRKVVSSPLRKSQRLQQCLAVLDLELTDEDRGRTGSGCTQAYNEDRGKTGSDCTQSPSRGNQSRVRWQDCFVICQHSESQGR